MAVDPESSGVGGQDQRPLVWLEAPSHVASSEEARELQTRCFGSDGGTGQSPDVFCPLGTLLEVSGLGSAKVRTLTVYRPEPESRRAGRADRVWQRLVLNARTHGDAMLYFKRTGPWALGLEWPLFLSPDGESGGA